MDILGFTDVLFLPNLRIGKLCKDLNTHVEQSIWYVSFQGQNANCLWMVNDIVTTMNSNNVLFASFELFPSYVAGILTQ